VTPLHVKLENKSGHPIEIAYRRFALQTGTGLRSTALPPFRIEGSVPQTSVAPVSPWYTWHGFHVAPYYSPYYYGWSAWGGPWYYDAPFYSSYVTWQKPLPTEDMLEKAFPEGVVETGGDVSGFLYFRRLGDNVKSVEFQARLFDAETEESVAALNVPFVITE
jgi:hypothetical protein